MKAATSAWNYTERGENWLGRHGAFFDTAEVESRLVTLDSDAVKLLLYLRAKNGKTATFMIANGLAWTTKLACRGNLQFVVFAIAAKRHEQVAIVISDKGSHLRPPYRGAKPTSASAARRRLSADHITSHSARPL